MLMAIKLGRGRIVEQYDGMLLYELFDSPDEKVKLCELEVVDGSTAAEYRSAPEAYVSKSVVLGRGGGLVIEDAPIEKSVRKLSDVKRENRLLKLYGQFEKAFIKHGPMTDEQFVKHSGISLYRVQHAFLDLRNMERIVISQMQGAEPMYAPADAAIDLMSGKNKSQRVYNAVRLIQEASGEPARETNIAKVAGYDRVNKVLQDLADRKYLKGTGKERIRYEISSH